MPSLDAICLFYCFVTMVLLNNFAFIGCYITSLCFWLLCPSLYVLVLFDIAYHALFLVTIALLSVCFFICSLQYFIWYYKCCKLIVSFAQLLPKLSRDFVKKGYLHKTPPNKNVRTCCLYDTTMFRFIIFIHLFRNFRRDTLCWMWRDWCTMKNRL